MTKKVTAYCVAWQSPRMSAPSFWYYRDYDRAVKEVGYMTTLGYRVTMRKVQARNPHFMDA